MALAVARHLGPAAREIRVGDCKFDVIAYDKRQRLFELVECKRGSHTTTIGHAFGQVATYRAVLTDRGLEFVDAVSKKLSLRYIRWMEATEKNRRIRVAFYVALTDKACKRVDFIRSVKRLHPFVGIIRVKPDDKCRRYIRINGVKDYDLAKARPATIHILYGKRTSSSAKQ